MFGYVIHIERGVGVRDNQVSSTLKIPVAEAGAVIQLLVGGHTGHHKSA